jgi:hypothetical protein
MKSATQQAMTNGQNAGNKKNKINLNDKLLLWQIILMTQS